METKDDGVFYIGHSSALVRLSGKLILCDPVWNHRPYGKFWKFVPEQIDCDSILDKVDACFISHIHEDHLCEPILRKLNCPIYIGENRPELTSRLLKTSLDIFTFPYFKWLHCLPGVQVYFIPHAFNSIDSSFFLRSNNFQVYFGNDNFLDEATCLRVQNDVGPTNVAMVPFAFIHSYPFLLQNLDETERTHEIHRLNWQSLDQAGLFLSIFPVQKLIPFGANLFYDDGADHILNSSLVSPFTFATRAPFAGSWFTEINEKYMGPSTDNIWKQFLEDELTKKQDYIVFDIGLNFGLTMINERLKKTAPLSFDHEIAINDSIIINAKTCGIKSMDRPPKDPFHRFMVDGPILKEWLDGKLTFEQVIGTRRFVYWRYPNEYNQPAWEWIMRNL